MSWQSFLKAIREKREAEGEFDPSDERGRDLIIDHLRKKTVLSVKRDYSRTDTESPSFVLSGAREGYVVLEREDLAPALEKRDLDRIEKLLQEGKEAVFFQTGLKSVDAEDRGKSVIVKGRSIFSVRPLSEAAVVFKRAFVRNDRELIVRSLKRDRKLVRELSVYDLDRWLSWASISARPERDFRSKVSAFFLKPSDLKSIFERAFEPDVSERISALFALYVLGKELPRKWKEATSRTEALVSDATKERIRFLARAVADPSQRSPFLSPEIFELINVRKSKARSASIL